MSGEASKGGRVVNVGSGTNELSFVAHPVTSNIDAMTLRKINASPFSTTKLNFTLVVCCINIY